MYLKAENVVDGEMPINMVLGVCFDSRVTTVWQLRS
jgi:hypothetical protein